MLKNFKLRSRSKSREKEAKYIPAAIIPSVAFVANPTLPINGSFEDNSNKFLNSTLNSSLIGLSAEYRKHQVDPSDDHNGDYNIERSQSVDRLSNASGGEMLESPEKSSEKKHKRKKKKEIQSQSENNNKRHISIANGLFSESRPVHHSKDVINNAENLSEPLSSHSLHDNGDLKSPKNFNFPSKKLGFDSTEDVRDDMMYENEHSSITDSSPRKETTAEKRYGISKMPLKSDCRYTEIGSGYNRNEDMYGIESEDKSPKSSLPVPSQFKDTTFIYEEEPLYSVSLRSSIKHPSKPEGEDRNGRQLKDEVKMLQDTIYRLSVEISHLLPDQRLGRPIGKSVFPGKGPAPSWIMNTKYLTPLLAAYDLKFQRQNAKIETMKDEILKFEKEIRYVMNENEELHSKIQMNAKNGHSDHREWHIIAKQTKLVIEENQLLLQELDVQQKRTEEIENKYAIEVAELKNALSKIKSQKEIEINCKVEEVKESANEAFVSSSNIKENLQSENNILQCKIEDLLKNKGSLETELEYLRSGDKKMKKKMEKLNSALQSEKEFHKYLSDVIDKSNEIANERDHLMEILELRDCEIRRVTNKLRNQIKYNLDIGIDGDPGKILSFIKTNDVAMDDLLTLESWMTLVVQFVEDLNNRCHHQEKDVHYYQNLLKEKDKSLQECEKENEELESKLDSVWRNATKDHIV